MIRRIRRICRIASITSLFIGQAEPALRRGAARKSERFMERRPEPGESKKRENPVEIPVEIWWKLQGYRENESQDEPLTRTREVRDNSGAQPGREAGKESREEVGRKLAKLQEE